MTDMLRDPTAPESAAQDQGTLEAAEAEMRAMLAAECLTGTLNQASRAHGGRRRLDLSPSRPGFPTMLRARLFKSSASCTDQEHVRCHGFVSAALLELPGFAGTLVFSHDPEIIQAGSGIVMTLGVGFSTVVAQIDRAVCGFGGARGRARRDGT